MLTCLTTADSDLTPEQINEDVRSALAFFLDAVDPRTASEEMTEHHGVLRALLNYHSRITFCRDCGQEITPSEDAWLRCPHAESRCLDCCPECTQTPLDADVTDYCALTEMIRADLGKTATKIYTRGKQMQTEARRLLASGQSERGQGMLDHSEGIEWAALLLQEALSAFRPTLDKYNADLWLRAQR